MKSTLQKSIVTFAILTASIAPFAAFAQTNTTTAKKTIDVACAQNAVEVRDTAIISALSVFSSSMTTALTVRKDALKASYALVTKQERSTAHKAAWSVYRASASKTHETLRLARKAAWSSFDTTKKTCKDSERNKEDVQESSNTTMSL